MTCHVERSETSPAIRLRRLERNNLKFFAKPVLSEVEGLRMTKLRAALGDLRRFDFGATGRAMNLMPLTE